MKSKWADRNDSERWLGAHARRRSKMKTQQAPPPRKAAGAHSVRAMYELGLECSDPQDRHRWLGEAAEKGYGPAMLVFGLECDDSAERRHWFREAAEEGSVVAMFHLGLECDEPEAKKRWLTRAAEKGHVPAMYELGMKCDNPQERTCWLSKAAGEGYVPAMYAFATECDDINKRKRWLTEAAANGSQPAKGVLEALNKLHVVRIGDAFRRASSEMQTLGSTLESSLTSLAQSSPESQSVLGITNA
jgi:TPR repeat protein